MDKRTDVYYGYACDLMICQKSQREQSRQGHYKCVPEEVWVFAVLPLL